MLPIWAYLGGILADHRLSHQSHSYWKANQPPGDATWHSNLLSLLPCTAAARSSPRGGKPATENARWRSGWSGGVRWTRRASVTLRHVDHPHTFSCNVRLHYLRQPPVLCPSVRFGGGRARGCMPSLDGSLSATAPTGSAEVS